MPGQTPKETSTLPIANAPSQPVTPSNGETSSAFSRQALNPLTSKRQVTEALAHCQPYILSSLPKAIRAFSDVLASEDPRLKLMAATKLLEGLSLLGSFGKDRFIETAEAENQRKVDQRLLIYGSLTEMAMKKSEKYKFPLPQDLHWLKPKFEEIEKELAERNKEFPASDSTDLEGHTSKHS
jgi:hypothetical protein